MPLPVLRGSNCNCQTPYVGWRPQVVAAQTAGLASAGTSWAQLTEADNGKLESSRESLPQAPSVRDDDAAVTRRPKQPQCEGVDSDLGDGRCRWGYLWSHSGEVLAAASPKNWRCLAGMRDDCRIGNSSNRDGTFLP